MPSPAQVHDEAAQRHSSDVVVVARRTAGLLVLTVGLVGLAVVTFRYRHLNDLTAIVFAVGAALLAAGVVAVIAIPLLELGPTVNAALLRWVGWVPGFGLVLMGITHLTDWKFYRDNGHWLTVHKKPTLDGVYDEGVVLIVLGALLIIAAVLTGYSSRRRAQA